MGARAAPTRNRYNIGIIPGETRGICAPFGRPLIAGDELAKHPADHLLGLVVGHVDPRLAVRVVLVLGDRTSVPLASVPMILPLGSERTLSGVPVGSVTLQRSPVAA